MNASKNVLGSDFARVDAHVIQPHEYDDLPEVTDADLERGTWYVDGEIATKEEALAAVRSRLKKQKINLALDSDVLGWYRAQAGGRGYQTLINATLRDAMTTHTLEDALRRVVREELRSQFRPQNAKRTPRTQ